MGWTNLSTWDGNFQSLDFLGEYVAAINERIRALDRSRWSSSMISIVAGDPLVGPGSSSGIAKLQGAVVGLIQNGWFVRHLDSSGNPITTLDGSEDGLTYLNHWTVENAAPFFTELPGAASFRRYRVHPSEGGEVLFGTITSGDIIGPWIFEDMQRALNLLVWTAHWGYWPTGNTPKARSGGDSTITEAETSFASSAEYNPGYGQTSQFNYYHYTHSSSYAVQSTRETIQAQWLEKLSWGQLILPAGPGVSGVMDVYAPPHQDNPDWEFDPGGFGLHGTTWTRMQAGIAIAPDDEIVAANEMGTTAYGPGSWPSTKTYRGYAPAGVGTYPRLLIQWNVPGGFEYVDA